MKTLRLDENNKDIEKMRLVFRKIAEMKNIPKNFELKVEYGNSDDFIIWNMKKIKAWVKADKDACEKNEMTIEKRFSFIWNKTIDDITKEKIREWVKEYKMHFEKTFVHSWSKDVEKIIKEASKEWLKKCKENFVDFDEFKDDLTETCDELMRMHQVL